MRIGDAVAQAFHYAKEGRDCHSAAIKLAIITSTIKNYSRMDEKQSAVAARRALSAVIDVMSFGYERERIRKQYGMEQEDEFHATESVPSSSIGSITRKITPLAAANMIAAVESCVTYYSLDVKFNFDPGKILLVTLGAKKKIKDFEFLRSIMLPHGALERGALSVHEHELNILAASSGVGYVWSSVIEQGQEFWIITDFSKKETCILLPNEF